MSNYLMQAEARRWPLAAPALGAGSAAPRPALRAPGRLLTALALSLGLLTACVSLAPPAAPPAAAPLAPTVPLALPEPSAAPPTTPAADLASPADQAARQLLEFHERLRQMNPAALSDEIARLSLELDTNQPAQAPELALELSLALVQQHNPGDLPRAAALLEPLVVSATTELQPWQAIAHLLAGSVDQQRRLDEALEREAAQLRDSQHTIQQLNEKLEALKAIERSMMKRSSAKASDGAAAARTP